MVFPQMVLMGFALIPVVLIETLAMRKVVGFTFPKTAGGASLANLCSTLLGVPLAWAFMFVVLLVTNGGHGLEAGTFTRYIASVTLQAAWLAPDEENLGWMIPCASTVLLLPCFVVSVFLERAVLAKLWAEKDRKLVYAAALRANVWSYSFLFLAGTALSIYSIVTFQHGPR
jgi:hypothetical protein